MGIILDSGAFSAWTRGAGAEVHLDSYIAFIKTHFRYIDYVVSLDVIPGRPGLKAIPKDEIERSAEQGWINYRKMVKAGIPKEKIIHVFHQNEDFSWLKRMVNTMEYIGLSPANDRTTREKSVWLDKCMKYVCDGEGMPVIRFHGFAVTALSLLLRYPWYSVDSATHAKSARIGKVIVPLKSSGGKWIYDDYDNSPRYVYVSGRTPEKKKVGGSHLVNLPPKVRFQVMEYFEEKGYELGSSIFRTESKEYKLKEGEAWTGREENGKYELEEVVKPGLCNNNDLRCELNAIYFLEVQRAFPKWPVPFKPIRLAQNQGFEL